MGALDQFRASETHPNGKEFDAYLKAVHVPNSAADPAKPHMAEVVGFGVAEMSDGKKPYVILRGVWVAGESGLLETMTKDRALILSQRNGREFARASDTEEALTGAKVFLTKAKVTFRGALVDSVQVTVPSQSHP
jgi:hypothetical protein